MRFLFSALLLGLSATASATDYSVSSPDGDIAVVFSDSDALARYSVNYKGDNLIRPSKLGFTFEKAAALYRDFRIEKVSTDTHDSNWEQPWGEQRVIRNHYNELAVRFISIHDSSRTFVVRARVFDDGLGFRYEVPADGDIAITRELTEFHLIDSHKATAYWIPGQMQQRYEYLYRETPLVDVDVAHTPLTVKYDNGIHVAFHEAALVDYAGMSIQYHEYGLMEAKLAPRSDGTKVKKTGSFTTPWRTITIGEQAVDLINSYIALNLNEPNTLDSTDWINPGKYIGIWWGMHIGNFSWGTDRVHGATTERTIEYMDFAARHGFDGVLVEGWNIGWDGNWIANSELFSFTQSYPDFDIKAVTDHGKKVGVKLVGHHETSGGITNYEKQMEAGFKLYQDHGVEQIKTGYVAYAQNLKVEDENGVMRYEYTDSQPLVNHFLHNVKTAANYELSINTHESVKDTGLRRTYPNWIARESARGQEYNSGWAAPNPADHIPMMAFTRMLAGPMDFTPGIFNLDYENKNNGGDEAGVDDATRPVSTLTKQLAEYVVLYSPIQMAADLPESYEANLPAFQFVKDVPTDWEKTVALQGEVGDFVVIARKEQKHRHYSGRDWYLGAITNEDARNLAIPLNFLDEGTSYEAQIYRDTKDTDWQTNPYAMAIETRNVKRGDALNVRIAAAGGLAVRFKAL